MFAGRNCGAGHCHNIDVTAALRVIHPGGRASVALELRTAESTTVSEEHRTLRSGTGAVFLACGATAAGERRCSILEGRSDSATCAARLRDDGTIARSCRWTERIDLDAP